MQPLKGIVMAMLAGTVMLAQEPNTPAANKPLTGDPGVQGGVQQAQSPELRVHAPGCGYRGSDPPVGPRDADD